MKTMSSQSCLILALLSLSLASAVLIGLNARRHGVTVQGHIAGMQLQGGPIADDEGSVEPDVDEGQAAKAKTCAQQAAHCPLKQELAFAVSEDRRPHESKALVVPGEKLPPQSKD